MTKRLSRAVRGLALAGLAAAAMTSQAAVYTSQASFIAANAGLTLQNFEGICGGGTCALPSFSGFTVSGPNLVVADGPSFGAPSDWLADNTFNGSLSISFAPAVNAVGFNLSAGFGGGNMVIDVFDGVTLLDSEVVATAGLGSFSSFFGIDGLGSINNLRLVVNNNANFVNIDNLLFGNRVRDGGTVPEPATLLLLGMAFVAVGAARSKRKA